MDDRRKWTTQRYFKMSAMHTYIPKLPLFTYYCNARGFVLINKVFIYLFYNFCHNETNIFYCIIIVYINNHKMLSGNIFGLILRNKMAATGVFCQS